MTDQMLSILAKEEDPNLEDEKIRLMEEAKENKLKMSQCEKKILYLLSVT
jgi:dynein heavy chain